MSTPSAEFIAAMDAASVGSEVDLPSEAYRGQPRRYIKRNNQAWHMVYASGDLSTSGYSPDKFPHDTTFVGPFAAENNMRLSLNTGSTTREVPMVNTSLYGQHGKVASPNGKVSIKGTFRSLLNFQGVAYLVVEVDHGGGVVNFPTKNWEWLADPPAPNVLKPGTVLEHTSDGGVKFMIIAQSASFAAPWFFVNMNTGMFVPLTDQDAANFRNPKIHKVVSA